jgi:hypothetical protein
MENKVKMQFQLKNVLDTGITIVIANGQEDKI